jgi:hypothetical protein
MSHLRSTFRSSMSPLLVCLHHNRCHVRRYQLVAARSTDHDMARRTTTRAYHQLSMSATPIASCDELTICCIAGCANRSRHYDGQLAHHLPLLGKRRLGVHSRHGIGCHHSRHHVRCMRFDWIRLRSNHRVGKRPPSASIVDCQLHLLGVDIQPHNSGYRWLPAGVAPSLQYGNRGLQNQFYLDLDLDPEHCNSQHLRVRQYYYCNYWF